MKQCELPVCDDDIQSSPLSAVLCTKVCPGGRQIFVLFTPLIHDKCGNCDKIPYIPAGSEARVNI